MLNLNTHSYTLSFVLEGLMAHLLQADQIKHQNPMSLKSA
jgi:hypothetical protein